MIRTKGQKRIRRSLQSFADKKVNFVEDSLKILKNAKYVLFGGTICVDIFLNGKPPETIVTHISARKLKKLYGLLTHECVFIEPKDIALKKALENPEINKQHFIYLYPRKNGDYKATLTREKNKLKKKLGSKNGNN